ncbi:hypothetical protein QJS83_02205 [Bdellovibrio sp. 22V]|uniref:hypothetical protein n=1 Tax=Bdellovibrio sp. 22V TaxID=3044166 RepID=UPI002543ACE1|nr:hypothetical protein [Bdellovibrio sp. 22V]WII72681.1 hypothetical protein QJS83_02205 [Bdellovibrio sp. 22V]
MLKIAVLLLTFCSFAKADYVGFSRGDQFTATPIQGQVQVTCSGFNGSGSAVYTCRDLVLDPQAYDVFLGPRDARADRVTLVASHEDGSSRTKSADYEGTRGRSGEAFNLWISTLFQKPLLENGVTSIRYTINGGHYAEPLAEGTFRVLVKRGPARTCPNARYTSSDVSDCNSQYSICQRYFEEFHNCL